MQHTTYFSHLNTQVTHQETESTELQAWLGILEFNIFIHLYLKEVLDNRFEGDALCQHLVQLDHITIHQNLPGFVLT